MGGAHAAHADEPDTNRVDGLHLELASSLAPDCSLVRSGQAQSGQRGTDAYADDGSGFEKIAAVLDETFIFAILVHMLFPQKVKYLR